MRKISTGLVVSVVVVVSVVAVVVDMNNLLLLLLVKDVVVVWDMDPPRQKYAASPWHRRGGVAQKVLCLSTVELVHTEYLIRELFLACVFAKRWNALLEERAPWAAIKSSVVKADEENFIVAS